MLIQNFATIFNAKQLNKVIFEEIAAEFSLIWHVKGESKIIW